MNKKMLTLILVIVVALCFLSIVVAENATHDGSSGEPDKTADDSGSIDNSATDKDTDKNKSSDKDKKDDKSKKNYILAKGHGNDIKFSDGFRGFILDYSKPPANNGDEFKRASVSNAPNSNTLKLAVVECYRQNMDGSIGSIMADFIKTGTSPTKVGKVVAGSSEIVGDTAAVKINNNTEAVFQFEVLKSVSGNVSNYFAYKVSFRSVDYEHILVPTNQTNETDEDISGSFTNNTTAANATALGYGLDNETNSTFLDDLYDYLDFLIDPLFSVWEPILGTITGFALMIIQGLEEVGKMFTDFTNQMQYLIDGVGRLIDLLGTIWKELSGFLKLFAVLLSGIEQLLHLILSALNFIIGLISTLISLVQQIINLILWIINFIISLVNQIIGFISGLINAILSFITNLINQLTALINAILDFLKSAGSFVMDVIANTAIIICAFIIVTVGTFVYDRSKQP